MMLLSSTCSTYATEVTVRASSAAKVLGPTGHLRYPCAFCVPYLTLTGSPINEADTPGETGTARAIPSSKQDRRDETTPGLLLSVRWMLRITWAPEFSYIGCDGWAVVSMPRHGSDNDGRND